ncbi:hypothetical protein LGK95_03615 [Clostridium algoriphilum]|uniref:hypothetical protein n=1 Tax=Clostridium algoriphilum TaxID=198347 RepID=UPI001CF43540|nr:hypothetical protein [Clostridium algoriphilum]MCB2292625.1 hypothetical protein [Clostridium algoriphilum]
MTLAVNIIGKDYLIMSIDSRETITRAMLKTNDGTISIETAYNDDKEKIHILPSNNVVSFVGNLSMSKSCNEVDDILYTVVDINESILGLTNSKYSKTLTFQQTVDYFKLRVPIIYKDFDKLGIFIGGYNNRCNLSFLKFCNGKLDKTSLWYRDNPGAINIKGTYEEEAKSFLRKQFGESENATLNYIGQKYIKNLNEVDGIKLCDSIINFIKVFCRGVEEDKKYVGGDVKTIIINKHGVRRWRPESHR